MARRLFRRLAGGRSPRWALMERFEIPNLDDPARIYLTRWRIVQTPWFALYLHRMDGPDSRITLHDHPYGFLSIILRGGYSELYIANPGFERETPIARRASLRTWRAGTVHLIRARAAHTIYSLRRTPTWTLLLVGPRWRTWGYWDETGWTPYDLHLHAKEFDRAMETREMLRRDGAL